MTEQGRYFYVDSIKGDDSCSGFTPEEAWRSLEKVNELIFQPGDHIRFRRGGEWHGMLRFQGNGSAPSHRLPPHSCSGGLWGRRDAPNTW